MVIGDSFIKITWEAAGDNFAATGYVTYQNDIQGANNPLENYLAEGLTPETKYTYKVRAIDAAGNISGFTQEINASTLKNILGTDTAPFDKTAPTVPQNLLASDITRTSANISWEASTDNFEVVQTENGADFNTANLQQYHAVVFLSTTGDVLNNTQQTAFENYMKSGGSFMGVHAATDTKYDWDWYGQLVGAYFDGHSNIQQATLNVANQNHPSTIALPNPWNRTDEWYNFKNISPHIHVLLNLDEMSYTGGTNGSNQPHA